MFSEREINDLVNGIVKDEAKKVQSMFDSASRQKGRPVSEVKSRLRSEASRRGYKFSDRELTDYAKAISDGTKITVEFKKK